MSWGAVIVAVGAVAGGAIAANGASDAADTQAGATRDANNATLTGQREALAAQKPFLEGGYAATNKLMSLLGLGDNTGAADFGSLNKPFSFTPGDLTQTPGYQFQLEQGQNALDRKAAAGGGFYSGANLKAAEGFGQQLAGTTFNDEYGRALNAYQTSRANTLNPLQALAGQGQTAANTTSNINIGTGNTLAQLASSLGNAQGASQIARGNAWSGAINNGLSTWQQANYLNKLTTQPGGSQGYFPQWGAGGGFGSGVEGMGG